MQEQLWFLHQLEPLGGAYNVPAAMRIKGALNIKALEQSLNRVVQRHEALRTSFQFIDGNLRQHVVPSLELKLTVTDFEGESDEPMFDWLRVEARTAV